MNQFHPDLALAQKYAYEPNKWTMHDLLQQPESKEYGACTFVMNCRRILFRVAKITPTKKGQFVTLWKRVANGPILPYDRIDPFDLIIISVRTPTHFGQFIFPNEVLWHKGFISKNGNGGKRAMRVYPPWDRVDSKQARNTQAWQWNYFVEISLDGLFDSVKLKKLF
jgi:hypothetical protein